MKPVLIVMEGIDGCGKDEQLRRLKALFDERDLPVAQVTEMGTTPLGKALRELVLHRTDIPIAAEQALLLYTTARAALSLEIKRLLATGTNVLVGRWVGSTGAYLGVEGVPYDMIRHLHATFVRLDPDITILLDLPAAKARERMLGRDRLATDRYERESVDHHERIRAEYYKNSGQNSLRIVDAGQTPEEVFQSVLRVCRDYTIFRRLFTLDAVAAVVTD